MRGIESDIYYPDQEALIKTILGRSYVVVACSGDDPDQIFGYLVTEEQGPDICFHWLYIKYPFRRIGLARGLLNAVIDNATPGTKFFASHIPVKGFFEHITMTLRITYDPKRRSPNG